MMQKHFEMPAAGRARRVVGTAALACCLAACVLLASGAVLLAKPSGGVPAPFGSGKADRLAGVQPTSAAAHAASSFVTVARLHGGAVTVLEKVAVAH